MVGDLVEWVVHASPDISTNLIAAALGGVLVWLATHSRRRIQLHSARRFWKAMGGRRPLIVLGAPDSESLNGWEKSGMVGKGDLLALVAIQSQLRRFGFFGRIVEAKELRPQDLRSDLILISGPDGNSVTATMLDMLADSLSYEFVQDPANGRSAILDRRYGLLTAPRYDERDDPVNDYGLIIRAANPLAPAAAEIVIVAGCWGYGTAAAADTLGDRRFVRKRKLKHFEVLVETTVVHGAHYNTKVLETREIGAPQQ